MDHNWGARKSNMSLDGGYNGSFQQALANLEIGRDQGRQAGLEQGLEQGRSEGYAEGWSAGAARANEKLQPLRAYVRQYFEEAVTLREQVKRQSAVIDMLHGTLSKIAQAQQDRPDDAGLAEMVSTLTETNRLQQAAMSAMQEQCDGILSQSKWRNRQWMRSLVIMNAAQRVLEELVADDTPEARQVREAFVHHYQQEVALGLEAGDLDLAPEQDEEFQQVLPQACQFVLSMLQSTKPPQQGGDPEPAE